MTLTHEHAPATARDHRARTSAFVLLAALGILALAGTIGFLLGRQGPSPIRAEVVALSSDGDSLCLDVHDQGNSCAQPLISPQDRGRVRPGVTVEVTETWVEQDGGRRLVFVVDVPD